MTKRAMLLFLVAALCVSCEKFAEGRLSFRELLALRDQIETEFKDKVGDVNISSNQRMTVKFIGSPLNSRTRDEKQQRADAVAAFVVARYKHPITSVSVQFASEGGAVRESYIGRPDGAAGSEAKPH